MNDTELWTLALMLAGGLLLLWKHKREYSRTNRYGVQEFSGFWNKLRSETFDNTLAGLGYGGILAGALLFAFTDTDAAGWVGLLGLILAIKAFAHQRRKS